MQAALDLKIKVP